MPSVSAAPTHARCLSPLPATCTRNAQRDAGDAGRAARRPRPEAPNLLTDGDVEVPPEGDHLWNFSGDLRTPQWCVSVTGILQTAAAQDLLGDPTAQYDSIQNINSCVVYDTPRTRSYEVPSKHYLLASYEKLPIDWEADAQHGRLEYTVRQSPPCNRAMPHGTRLHRSPTFEDLPCHRPMSSRALRSARSSCRCSA